MATRRSRDERARVCEWVHLACRNVPQTLPGEKDPWRSPAEVPGRRGKSTEAADKGRNLEGWRDVHGHWLLDRYYINREKEVIVAFLLSTFVA